ncbi:MAG TPA: hypothetical protein VGK86_04605 [Thermoanaerobaculia bacterium]
MIPASGLRVMVLERDDQDAAAWRAIRDLGANVVATLRPPSAETDELASAAGLTYLAFLTTDDIRVFASDASRIAEARAERSLAGFYFWDAQVTEGFTTPEAQQQAYSTLKLLFPGKLVLYPTRLDPIVWNPDFLDRYFRPEFTDLVTPYFYPVGTTVLGEAREGDAWSERLGGLLSAVAPRLPPGKGVLPVLQGFEQEGYPFSSRFLGEQFAVYRNLWPNLSNAAVFAWKFSTAESAPLIEIAGRPDLQEGVCDLFARLSRASDRRSKRAVSWR